MCVYNKFKMVKLKVPKLKWKTIRKLGNKSISKIKTWKWEINNLLLKRLNIYIWKNLNLKKKSVKLNYV